MRKLKVFEVALTLFNLNYRNLNYRNSEELVLQIIKWIITSINRLCKHITGNYLSESFKTGLHIPERITLPLYYYILRFYKAFIRFLEKCATSWLGKWCNWWRIFYCFLLLFYCVVLLTKVSVARRQKSISQNLYPVYLTSSSSHSPQIARLLLFFTDS